MSTPAEWIVKQPQGLLVKPASAYIDPMQPVEHAIITHGHADHARAGHKHVYATPETLAIMATRYGQDHARFIRPIPYRKTVDIGESTLTFYPAGHILGSAQAAITHANKTVVFAGDYKRTPDPTCEPFEPVDCDVFVTEATFGLPVFKHPDIRHEMKKLLSSLSLFPERCHLVGVYALGKCQRVLLALRDAGYEKPVFLHGALSKLCDLYIDYGFNFGELIAVSDVADLRTLAGEIVLAPPSALADRWSRKLPNVLTCMASGWMQIRARSKQRRAELPLIISDHADWPELLRTLQDVNAPEVWVTHGREDALLHQARKMGFKAQALSLVGYEEDDSS
ncbi:ligase-associated DNA damage response exonuclease [Aestuariibacter salexigens]|uniref:ligase-associated DNA damage response exonuclease n=1 Tax=Aestuariibacter salexigens TaxID=226010 RepID=UPI0003FEE801|nr:ligase-associated DNA damage response exonuclease [Aestuariibacter salexigens]